MAQVILDMISSFGSCFNCFGGSPTLKINGRSFKILRLLGEGGFSYVYLVQDTSSAELLALKKIRCPFGAESVAQAMREVDAYKLFARSPGIIHSVDYSVSPERSDPSSKTVYVLLPYYRRGNLQDMINANLVNHTSFPERKLMLLFLGVCRALRDMHQYHPDGGAHERMEMPNTSGGGKSRHGRSASKSGDRSAAAAGADDEDETEQQRPLMADDNRVEAEGGPLRSNPSSSRPGNNTPSASYAHRDIKPGNIMISDDGAAPILMDLGSIQPSPTPITSRSQAIAVQDAAAEHSTMPYRAPELFDVKTGTVIDTKVDVWSLGCTLYACLVGKSPFEARSDETGGSLSICVLSGDWRFPDEGPLAKKKKRVGTGMEAPPAEEDAVISEPIKELVRRCLTVEPGERPDIDELIGLVEGVLERLPEDGVQ